MTIAAVTVDRALRRGADRLAALGIDDPRREARLLLSAALDTAPATLLRRPQHRLAPEIAQTFESLLDRRAGREPISQIMGRREFWSLEFAVTPEILTPRPDSETVVEAALAAIDDHDMPLRILDLGTGSGCLLLALLSELPRSRGVGVDISMPACRVAAGNASALGMSDRAKFVADDWGNSLAGPFDLIVANPPYIPSADIAGLMPEVRDHEPRAALDGGDDGLTAYRRLLPFARSLLSPAGSFLVEIGAGQADRVDGLLRAADLEPGPRYRDLAGIDRVLSAAIGTSYAV
ncbi:MAG: peptide chain release factor N(5)-glutamine methyltransferase [Alphaproteobacteria bacterium]|nr:peptide chain release factor N(5)-glutamine methyltransferase [Alphaproteobacteria bacterium]